MAQWELEVKELNASVLSREALLQLDQTALEHEVKLLRARFGREDNSRDCSV